MRLAAYKKPANALILNGRQYLPTPAYEPQNCEVPSGKLTHLYSNDKNQRHMPPRLLEESDEIAVTCPQVAYSAFIFITYEFESWCFCRLSLKETS